MSIYSLNIGISTHLFAFITPYSTVRYVVIYLTSEKSKFIKVLVSFSGFNLLLHLIPVLFFIPYITKTIV